MKFKGYPRFIFKLHDSDTLDISPHLHFRLDCVVQQHGVLFWCNEGEWRAIGGPQLQQRVQFIHDCIRLGDAAVCPPDINLETMCQFSWDEALPVPTELVRWLRQEAQELGETDTTAESTAK